MKRYLGLFLFFASHTLCHAAVVDTFNCTIKGSGIVPLQASADTYVQQNRVEFGRIRASQRRRANGAKDRLRVAMRAAYSGADFSERRLDLSRFAGGLPAQDQQSDQIVHDGMRMTRMRLARPTPTLMRERPSSSVRTAAPAEPLRTLAAIPVTAVAAAASVAATESKNGDPGRRQHKSLPSAALNRHSDPGGRNRHANLASSPPGGVADASSGRGR